MRNYLLLLFLFLVNIYSTCKKSDCVEQRYTFEGHYKAYPDRDSLHIGDTIWLELNLPTHLLDLQSGQTINFESAVNLGPSITFLQLTGGDNLNPGATYAANDFDYRLVKGLSLPLEYPDRARGFKCAEENDLYSFKLGIIPKRKGLFAFGTSNGTNVSTKSTPCVRSNFDLTFKETNQHIYLYEQSRPGYTVSKYEREHMYVFVVY